MCRNLRGPSLLILYAAQSTTPSPMWTAVRPGPRLLSLPKTAFPLYIRRLGCHAPLKNPQNYIFEPEVKHDEDGKDLQKALGEVRHYLRTDDISEELRDVLVGLKTESLLAHLEPDLEKETLSTIEAVFAYYTQKKVPIAQNVSNEALQTLFILASNHVLATKSEVPNFLLSLALEWTRSADPIPNHILVNIIHLGASSKLSGLASSLTYVLRGKRGTLDAEFTRAFLDSCRARQLLSLDTFEALLAAAKTTGASQVINADFSNAYIEYLEEIFEYDAPDLHEFRDHNKNIYRIQGIANQLVHQFNVQSNAELLLKLLKCKADLNSVFNSAADLDAIDSLLVQLEAQSQDFQDVKNVIFKQDLADEQLCESLLAELALRVPEHSTFLHAICDFVAGDDVKFTTSLRLRARIIQALVNLGNCPAEEKFSHVQAAYASFLDEDVDIVSDVVLGITAVPQSDSSKLLHLALQDLPRAELSLYDTKSIVDNCLWAGNTTAAYEAFEKSVDSSLSQWAESDDPAVGATLSRLVVALASGDEPITEFFPKFRKVKQHMPVKGSPDAIYHVAKKMLAEGFIGDVIELLKREFPKMERDSCVKIRVDTDYGAEHRKVFDLIHNFILEYSGEETFEANWVLYGELHNYFQVPYESYFDAIKFFCERDRLHAALLIVRRMKMLSNLHSEQNGNFPPLREMFMYLFQVFGENLYEKGVAELHEILKTDTDLQTTDIDMQNCILNAYSNLQLVGKARDLFLAISANPKDQGGANEETIQIMIKTFTYGDMDYVRKFWNNLSQYGVFPNYAIFRQYLIAHAYYGLIDDAKKLLSEVDDYNLEFSSDLLMCMHNYCLDPEKQKEVQEWAKIEHKDAWRELVESGSLRSATPYATDDNLLGPAEQA